MFNYKLGLFFITICKIFNIFIHSYLILITDSRIINLYYQITQDIGDDWETSCKTPLGRGVDSNRSSIVYYLVKHCGQDISTIDQVHS